MNEGESHCPRVCRADARPARRRFTTLEERGRSVARRNGWFVALALLAALGIALAAAPAADTKGAARKPSAIGSETESNEQIVADFLHRKERAETAQRAIVGDFRRILDRKRAEFEDARRRFDDARGRYTEIVGPLAKQGVFSPLDPRHPYEFEVRRLGPEPGDPKPGYLSRRDGEARSKPIPSEPTSK